MHEELDRQAQIAINKHLDRRALIFIEEAISNYIGRHGVKRTRQYLSEMIDYLNEFEREGNNDV